MRRVAVALSTTEIVSTLALATYSRPRGSSQTSAVGCSPTSTEPSPAARRDPPAPPCRSTRCRGRRRRPGRRFGARPVGSVGSPPCGQRPPQWLTQATAPSRLIDGADRARPRPSSRARSRDRRGVDDGQRVLEDQRHHRPPARRRRTASAPARCRPRSAEIARVLCRRCDAAHTGWLRRPVAGTRGRRGHAHQWVSSAGSTREALQRWRTGELLARLDGVLPASRGDRAEAAGFGAAGQHPQVIVALPNVTPKTRPSNTLCMPAGVIACRVVMTPGSVTPRSGCWTVWPCERRTAARPRARRAGRPRGECFASPVHRVMTPVGEQVCRVDPVRDRVDRGPRQNV